MEIDVVNLFGESDNVKDRVHTLVDFISTDNTTLQGAELSAGVNVKVLFTDAIMGTDSTTPLTLTYNDVEYGLKVGKNGSLADIMAYEISTDTFEYIQPYTTLELFFDGTQFVIVGNPILISDNSIKIYANGCRLIVSTTNISAGSALPPDTFYFVRSN